MADINRVNLKQKIIDEMTVDYSHALEKQFDLAKQFIRITKEGKVDILNKDKMSGKELVSLYLIGKLYSKEAGYSVTDDVGNSELMNELGIPKGSLLPWLKELRDANKIKPLKKGKYTYHAIAMNMVEKILRSIELKLKKHG